MNEIQSLTEKIDIIKNKLDWDIQLANHISVGLSNESPFNAQAISELKSIKQEIKNLNSRGKQLRSRKKELEEQILTFLQAEGQSGVKYRGMAIVAEDTTRRKKKPDNIRTSDGLSVMRKWGLNEDEGFLKELLEAVRGEPEPTQRLSISQIKPRKPRGR